MFFVLFRLSAGPIERFWIHALPPRIAKEAVELVDKATVVTYCQFNFVKRRADFLSTQQGQTKQTANDVLYVWFTHILVLETQFMYAFDNGLREMKPIAGHGNIFKDATKRGNRQTPPQNRPWRMREKTAAPAPASSRIP